MALREVISAAIVLISVVYVTGYPNGAPTSPKICSSLTPQHGPTTPQNGVPPYDFSLSKTNVNAGERVTVIISKQSNGRPFKGFMLQARAPGGSKAVGTWVSVPGVSKGMACFDQSDSSATHVDATEKENISLDWIPPAPGTYEILQTVVENGGTYWTGHKSQTITVS